MPHNRIAFTVTLGELAEVPGSPFAYWAPKSLRELFKKFPPLDRDVARRPDQPKIADVKQGLATADGLRFTRYWWEVPVERIGTSREETFRGKKWVPFAKGGKPFYHDIQLVVNWERNGEEIKSYRDANGRLLSRPQNESYYFRAGLKCGRAQSWSQAARTGRLAVSHLPQGVIYDARSMAIISVSNVNPFDLLGLLGAKGTNTLVFIQCGEPAGEVSHIARLPVRHFELINSDLSTLSSQIHRLLREWSTGDESSTAFVAPWILQLYWRWQGRGNADLKPTTGHPLARDFEWRYGVPQEVMDWLSREMERGFSLRTLAEACVRWEVHLRREIGRIQQEIDDEVYHIYGISEEDRVLIEAELSTAPEEAEEEGEGEPDEMEETSPEGLLCAEEHIKRLVHFLAHQAVREDPDGIVPLSDCYPAGRAEMEPGLRRRVREKLKDLFGEDAMPTVEREIREALGRPLNEWLAREFFSYHLGLYRLRPVIWQVVPLRGSSSRRSSRTSPSPETFSVFLYWHKLDADTLRKVRSVYLQPYLDSASRAVREAQRRLLELQSSGASIRTLRDSERELNEARAKEEALRRLADAIDSLLRPHSLNVQSRSEWVKEKVNEIVSQGYHPNRDYGVRVNIEPLKQA
ncbi:MAG: hypothetical protein DRP94_03930, partial [Candidatus Latescibacterota bacterium]